MPLNIQRFFEILEVNNQLNPSHEFLEFIPDRAKGGWLATPYNM